MYCILTESIIHVSGKTHLFNILVIYKTTHFCLVNSNKEVVCVLAHCRQSKTFYLFKGAQKN